MTLGVYIMSVLKAESLVKIYGGRANSTRALNGMNIEISKGEFVGVMGPSGSGKTTLLNLLGGLDSPTSGQIQIDNNDLNSMTKDEMALFRRGNIGFVFQDFNLLDSLNIKENIMLPLILEGLNSSEMEKKTEKLMLYLDIYQIAEKYPYNVSGGQQQKAVVARALINDPTIIMADEPTGNLDSKSSRKVMECLEELNKEKESSILTVTHDPLAASYCTRIVFIKDGALYMELVKKNERSEFFDRIMDCLAVLEGDKK